MSDDQDQNHTDSAAELGATTRWVRSWNRSWPGFRKGERPSLTEFFQRYPALADEIREVLPGAGRGRAARLARRPPAAEAGSEAESGQPSATVALDYGGRAGCGPRRRAPPFGPSGWAITASFASSARGEWGWSTRPSASRCAAAWRSRSSTHRFRNRRNYLRRFHRGPLGGPAPPHQHRLASSTIGEHDGVCYYAMQYIAGHSLDKVLADIRRIREDKAGKAAVQPELQGAALKPFTRPATPTPAPASLVTEAEAPDDLLGRTITQGLLTGRYAPPGAAGGPQVARLKRTGDDRGSDRAARIRASTDGRGFKTP